MGKSTINGHFPVRYVTNYQRVYPIKCHEQPPFYDGFPPWNFNLMIKFYSLWSSGTSFMGQPGNWKPQWVRSWSEDLKVSQDGSDCIDSITIMWIIQCPWIAVSLYKMSYRWYIPSIRIVLIYPLVNQHNYGKSPFESLNQQDKKSIFNSHVKLPEAIYPINIPVINIPLVSH